MAPTLSPKVRSRSSRARNMTRDEAEAKWLHYAAIAPKEFCRNPNDAHQRCKPGHSYPNRFYPVAPCCTIWLWSGVWRGVRTCSDISNTTHCRHVLTTLHCASSFPKFPCQAEKQTTPISTSIQLHFSWNAAAPAATLKSASGATIS